MIAQEEPSSLHSHVLDDNVLHVLLGPPINQHKVTQHLSYTAEEEEEEEDLKNQGIQFQCSNRLQVFNEGYKSAV